MEEEVPDFFKERDVFGQIKSKLPDNLEQPKIRTAKKLDVTYAGLGIRMLASLLDGIIVFIPLFFVLYSIAINDNDIKQHSLRYDFASTLFYVLYYGITESSDKQASFGKRITKLKVIKDNGEPLSFKTAALRYIAKALSIIPLGFGVWAIQKDKKHQGWHDLLMGTYVIYDKK